MALSTVQMQKTSIYFKKYFKKLLREVLTKYGDIFYVRFDGAAEENKNGYKIINIKKL